MAPTAVLQLLLQHCVEKKEEEEQVARRGFRGQEQEQ